MPTYRIERTEMITRVWIITAESEDEALEAYGDEEPSFEQIDSPFCDVNITLDEGEYF